jgi:hypothetical protein
MGAPLATTVWSFVILAIVIALIVWLVVTVVNRTGRGSDTDQRDDTQR